uniref:DNA replication regulator Sld3 C-terminal domain-containing protein n=1 Tax=Peronospora matthiolae TaxID=2874970 RepID=A0AAV1URK2_9STRA
MVTDWQVEYLKAVAVEDERPSSVQTNDTSTGNVLEFLDLVLAQEGGEWWTKLQRRVQRGRQTRNAGQWTTPALDPTDETEIKTLKKRLAAIGTALLVPLPELEISISRHEPLRPAKVRVLQLQLVCRILRYGALIGRKEKEEKKLQKQEMRGLLDRVALLLDAANPPSLMDDGAEERSPFHEFLEHQLGARLMVLMPGLMRYLLKVYELEDEGDRAIGGDENGVGNAVLSTAVIKARQCPLVDTSRSSVAGNDSILSALRQERSAKRDRPIASNGFKEVQLPHQLKQTQMQSRPRKSRRRLEDHCSSSESSQDTMLGTPVSAVLLPICKAERLTKAHRSLTTPGQFNLPGGSLRRAPAKTLTARLLHTRMPENCLYKTAASSSIDSAVSSDRAAPGKRTLPKPTTGRPMRISSVVGRTPERPKKLAARGTRVLVEASPPLRGPNTARTSAMRLVQPTPSRRGAIPPLLFQ